MFQEVEVPTNDSSIEWKRNKVLNRFSGAFEWYYNHENLLQIDTDSGIKSISSSLDESVIRWNLNLLNIAKFDLFFPFEAVLAS